MSTAKNKNRGVSSEALQKKVNFDTKEEINMQKFL